MALTTRDKEVLDELLGKSAPPSLLGKVYSVFPNQRGYYHSLGEFYGIIKKESAWDYLYLELRKLCRGEKSSFVQNYPEADFKDVFHDAFISFSNEIRMRKYQGKASLKTYFLAILRNQKLKFIQKSKTDPVNINSSDPVSVLNNLANSNEKDIHFILSLQAREIMLKAAEFIGKDCLERLELFHLDGLQHKQVETLLNSGQSTRANRLANNCAHSFRSFFCEHPHLLEYLGHLEKLQDFIKNRKQVLIELNDFLGENCSRALQLHNICSVRDGRVENMLKHALEKTSPPDAAATDDCQLKILGFFSSRQSDLHYFGIQLEQGRISINTAREN